MLHNTRKWRICRAPQYAWKWCVFAPGFGIVSHFVGDSFQDCLTALPDLQRNPESARQWRAGR